MYKHIFILSCTASCFFSCMVYADNTLRGSVGLGYSLWNISEGRTISNTIYTTLYLSKVSKEIHPWKEAAFMQHTSILNASVSKTHSSYKGYYNSNSTYATFGGIYASHNHPWVLGANLDHYSFDYSLYTYKQDSYSLIAGSYIGKNTLLILDYSKSKTKFSFSGIDYAYSYGVKGKSLFEYSNGTAFAIFMIADYIKYDSYLGSSYNEKFVQLSPEFYFNQTTSLKLDYSQNFDATNNSGGSRFYRLGMYKFINPSFALEASLAQADCFGGDQCPGTYKILKGELWF